MYGQTLPADVWAQIDRLTNVYLKFGTKEKTTTPITVMIHKLRRLQKAAKSLRDEMCSAPLVPSDDLRHIVDTYFRSTNIETETDELGLNGAVLHCLDAILELTAFAILHYGRSEERDYQMSPEGSWWSFWIVSLGKILNEAGLPTAVRKDRMLQANDKPSPFVLLVYAIQESIPIELRRHMPSEKSRDKTIYLDALSQAIWRARQSMASLKSFFGEDMHHLWTSLLTGTGTNAPAFPTRLRSRNPRIIVSK